jgi:hypothetical protein
MYSALTNYNARGVFVVPFIDFAANIQEAGRLQGVFPACRLVLQILRCAQDGRPEGCHPERSEGSRAHRELQGEQFDTLVSMVGDFLSTY